jgi:plasmid stabilization system protein ParE
MGYQIIWLPKAEERYQQVIEYLQAHWNDTVIKKFVGQTEKILAQVQQRPTMFRRSAQMGIYEVLITKHNLLLYRIKGKRIELLTFFDTRQHPKKKFR